MDTVAAGEAASPSARARLVRGLTEKGEWRFVKFAIVGGSGVFVNLAVVAVCAAWVFSGLGSATFPLFGEVALTNPVSITVGILVSIFTNFLLNDGWTWGDRAKGTFADAARRCRTFYVTNALAAALQLVVAGVCLSAGLWNRQVFGLDLVPWEATLSSLVGIVVATPLNYVVNNVWTFRERDDAQRG